ncbi:MAG: DoxX family protein [Acidobacteriota bacterium]
MTELAKTPNRIAWTAQIVVAVILIQTLFFKFTGAQESVHIFETLGLEPVGRIGSGIAELIASVLLLIPSTAAIGAVTAAGVMVGAIGSHLFTPLGIEVLGDGGLLFGMAVTVFVLSLTVAYLRRHSLPIIGQRLP